MKLNVWKAVLVFLACFAAICLIGWLLVSSFFPGRGGLKTDTIALVDIEGVITSGSASGGLLGGDMQASSVQICDRIYRARDDESVKGILIRVDSPGGSAAGSDEIYRAIESCRGRKPVVVSMGDVAASGGYYLSSAADYIFANGATLTGSIGVIFSLVNWEQLAKKVGVQDQTLTAGTLKDIGSPWRAMKPEEKQMLLGLMKEVHQQFISAVAKGRKKKLTEEQVRALATGMVFTGERAVKNGLIDEIGGLEQAKIKVRALAGVPADQPVEEYGVPSLFDTLLGVRGGKPLSAGLFSGAGAQPREPGRVGAAR